MWSICLESLGNSNGVGIVALKGTIHSLSVALLVALLFSQQSASAQQQVPDLGVATYGKLVSINWTAIDTAHSYRLYYAPFPDAEIVSNILLGAVNSLYAELPLDSAFYLAVAAITDVGEQQVSNVVSFTVSEENLDSTIEPITGGDWKSPALEDRWQWQLLGEVNHSYEVEVYDIDLFDVAVDEILNLKSQGRNVVCYFSAGSFEDFRDDAVSFPAAVLGLPLDGFPNEKWLDIRSAEVHKIVLSRLDVAKNKACDGVEPDNMDAYVNDSGFDLTAEDQLAFNKFVANEAHARGMSVALKNDLDQIPELVEFFDFSVNEQCHEFSECELLLPFIEAGKPVFNAEYANIFADDIMQREIMCETSIGNGFDTLILPLDLDDSFRISCQ